MCRSSRQCGHSPKPAPPTTADELWLVEHPPVFTPRALAASPTMCWRPVDIPVVRTDRGGQVTYHGPGQLVVYSLIDLRRRRLGVRDLVTSWIER